MKGLKWVCPNCGSDKVLEPYWVYINDDPIEIGDRIEDSNMCESCDSIMEVVTLEEYEKTKLESRK
mgnify:FL=1